NPSGRRARDQAKEYTKRTGKPAEELAKLETPLAHYKPLLDASSSREACETGLDADVVDRSETGAIVGERFSEKERAERRATVLDIMRKVDEALREGGPDV